MFIQMWKIQKIVNNKLIQRRGSPMANHFFVLIYLIFLFITDNIPELHLKVNIDFIINPGSLSAQGCSKI